MLVFLILFQLARAATDPTVPLSLKDAYLKAMDLNPALLQSRENVNQVATGIPLARALILPNVNGTVQEERLKGAANNGNTTNSSNDTLFNGSPYNQYTAGVNLQQPLFAIGTLAAIDSAKKDKKITEYTVEINSRNLGTSVIQAYFQVALNMHNVDALNFQEKIVRESLQTTEHRYHTGRSQLLDVLQVKTTLALLVSQLVDARNQVDIAAANLASILGEPHAKAYAIKNNLRAPPLEKIDADVDIKRFHLPELEQNKVQLLQIEDKKEISLGTNLPNLKLFGDYNYKSYTKTDIFDGNNRSWDIGITLTVPIFSGFSAFYQHDALTSQQIQLEFARKVLENQTNLQQVTSRKQLETAAQDLLAGQEALDLSLQSSKEAIRQYKLVTIDLLTFLTIQQNYVQAQQTLNTDKYNYLVALATYYSASGQEMGHLVGLLDEANR